MNNFRHFFRAGFVLCVLLCMFLGGCSSGPANKYGTFNENVPLVTDTAVLTGKLDNGMSYYVLGNPKEENRIFLRLAVKAGSILEDDDQKGVAHFVEHMAFNGTEHFAENELINYFESIGMAFGPEINAYTSFNETVYMLEVPADDPEMLDQALLVLHDWASALTFDETELEKERGVVIEEWRLGRGANGRVQDKQLPFLFNGSKYAERLPIGDPEIIRTISRDRVIDFYKEWYRPDLMAVILVGDADPQKLVSAIKKTMGTIPAPEETRVLPEYSVPPRTEADILVVRDPELKYTTIQILEQKDFRGIKTAGQFREEVIKGMALSIFNDRLAEKTQDADPVMLSTYAGFQQLAKTSRFSYLGMIPQPGRFEEAFEMMITELLRLQQFGITETEFSRKKETFLESVEQDWLNSETVLSSERIGDLLQVFLYGEPMLSKRDQYNLYMQILPYITLEDLNGAVENWLTGRGNIMMISAPESAADIPDRAGLFNLWQNWIPEEPLTPYEEDNSSRPLFEDSDLPGPSGKITAEKKYSKTDIREWILSNGAKVYFLKTDFMSNENLFYAFSKGGASLVQDRDYPSSIASIDYALMSGLNNFSAIELEKKLAAKTVRVTPWLTDSWEGFDGISSNKDIETLLQLVNLYFSKPYFTDSAWASYIIQQKAVVESRKNAPVEQFINIIWKLVYNNDPRRQRLSENLVAEMDRKTAEAIFRERFTDAGDFTFVFVGSANEKELKDLCIKYIGSLPSSGKKEDARYTGKGFPSGVVSDTLKMGIEPQSRVYMGFGGDVEFGPEEYELFDIFMSLMDIRLREVIREKMGGSYGVSVYGSLTGYPKPRFLISIEFGCEPGREEALSDAVIEQIHWLQNTAVPQSYITKLRETYRRSSETGFKNNKYWQSRITQSLMRGIPVDAIKDTETTIELITPERMRQMANTYLDTGNYVRAVLLPQDAP
ncbi:insulinase family protein [Brucepastera parasyntrophica]|uniref:M16 family metallopeptidase n=1 Tax=Brucepastera parasyntrophica TaxID=2880008 RepID=UPI00210AFFF0|nr:M16 family metallopeptidase [Brucepastera parasyntrophica]ULQ58766.1 insulinase family protein [Brucepastera parasyntrophica]